MRSEHKCKDELFEQDLILPHRHPFEAGWRKSASECCLQDLLGIWDKESKKLNRLVFFLQILVQTHFTANQPSYLPTFPTIHSPTSASGQPT